MCVAVLVPTLHNIIVTALFGLGLFLRATCEEDLLVRAEGYGAFRNRVKNLFLARGFPLPPAWRPHSFGSGSYDKISSRAERPF
jgi:hypothetical protein